MLKLQERIGYRTAGESDVSAVTGSPASSWGDCQTVSPLRLHIEVILYCGAENEMTSIWKWLQSTHEADCKQAFLGQNTMKFMFKIAIHFRTPNLRRRCKHYAVWPYQMVNNGDVTMLFVFSHLVSTAFSFLVGSQFTRFIDLVLLDRCHQVHCNRMKVNTGQWGKASHGMWN